MDVGTLRQSVDLLALVERDTHLKRVGAGWWAGACPFCGGRDRFTIKRTPDGYRWLCRHCTDDKYLDVVDYVQRRDGLTFVEAVRKLGAEPSPLRDDDLPPMRSAEPPQEQDPQVIERLTSLALEAVRRRLDDEILRPIFEEYLQRRGLAEETADAALLGVAMAFDTKLRRERPAVSIPYIKADFEVQGIKFRFCDDAPGGLRYVMERGSKAGLYSLPERLGRSKRLLILEGELNLLSVAQVTADDLDLVSTGSQTLGEGVKRDLLRLAASYGRAWCWFDEPQRAVEIARLVRGVPVRTPVVDNRKMDANAMLAAGVLERFLNRLLEAR